MAATHHNVDDGELQPNVTLTIDRENKWTLAETYVGKYSTVLAAIPAIGTAHATYDYTALDRANFTGIEGDQARLVLTYVGTNNEGAFDPDDPETEDTPNAVYTIEQTTATEPLLTNPYFVDNLTAPQLEQVRDYIAEPDSEKRSALEALSNTYVDDFLTLYDKGVDSYLAPGAVYSKSYVSDEKVSSTAMNLVGKISTPPGAPGVGDGYNWLFIGASQSAEGSLYNIKLSWRLSGPDGWDSNLYA